MVILLFFYFAAMIILGALLTISMKSVVHSAVALLVTFFHVAGIYILLNAEFLAAVQIIVYAGAILVLYLFVIMLFNIKTAKDIYHKQLPLAVGLGIILFIESLVVLYKSDLTYDNGGYTVDVIRQTGNTQVIGQALFTDFLYPFEVASVILLVALVGAVLLAPRRGLYMKKGS